MTSKERVLCAFQRIKSDRVPVDYFANAGIQGRLMKRLKADSHEELLKALNVDFRMLWVQYAGKLLFPEIPGRNVDPVYGFYTRWVEHETGGYWDFCDFPLKGAGSEVIENFPVPDPDDFDYGKVYELCNHTWRDLAVYAGCGGIADVINNTGRLMGMEDTLVNLMIEDEATLSYVKRRAKMELGIMERILDKAKGGISFVWIGEDLGTQKAPMISLELYRRVLRPIHQQYIDLAKSYHLPVMIHTCGSSSWVYNDFIEMGIDAVDTLQPEAANMSPGYLVENFKGRLSFHGCISTAGAVAYGTPSDVEKEVKDVYEIMKPTYSYMFSPTHCLQDNSPVENVLQMYECGLRYGKY